MPKQGLGLPVVVADGCGFAKAACAASFVADVVGASAASAAFYVDGFTLAFAH